MNPENATKKVYRLTRKTGGQAASWLGKLVKQLTRISENDAEMVAACNTALHNFFLVNSITAYHMRFGVEVGMHGVKALAEHMLALADNYDGNMDQAWEKAKRQLIEQRTMRRAPVANAWKLNDANHKGLEAKQAQDYAKWEEPHAD